MKSATVANVLSLVTSQQQQRPIASLRGALLNTTSDQALALLSGITRWIPRRIVCANPSGTPILAAGGVYTAASRAARRSSERPRCTPL